VTEDHAKAFRWFSEGHDARCRYLTISMYQLGIGVKKDEAKAIALLQDISTTEFYQAEDAWLKECTAHGRDWRKLIIHEDRRTVSEMERELRNKQKELKQLERSKGR